MRMVLCCAAALLAMLLGTPDLRAGTVHGTVTNGTTGQPAAGVDVVLLQLQGGMTPVASTKTDATGQFTFEHPGIGAQPMLVRAAYKGVNFHQALPPGKDTVRVEVFEPTGDAKSISVPSHVVIFQPNGATLTVGEEYEVKNDATPPQAYFKSDGNFEMALPDKAELKQIAASGPSGMPVVQAPIDKGRNRYAIAFAFRPGESDVRLSYELAYPNNAATVTLPNSYGGRLLLVAPPGVRLTGKGLEMAGQEQGMNVYETSGLAAGTPVVAFEMGSVPEIIEDGVTGYLVQGIEEAVHAVHLIRLLDRRVCRHVFEKRFSVERMCLDYEAIYEKVAGLPAEQAIKLPARTTATLSP